MKNTKETMKIVFEGQTHQIDSNTLINFLIHYNTIVGEVNRNIGDGTKKVVVKVNAIEKGSFAIDLELVENALTALFSSETMTYLGSLVGIISGVFTLHKNLKGKPVPEENISTVMEINDSNKSIIINNSTINIYNQPVVREAISKSIETVDQDPAVEGLRLDNKNKIAVSILKEEFKDMVYDDFSNEELRPNEKILIDDNAMLGITKLSFEKGSRWNFIYKGFKISIAVKDNELMRHIDNGARFAKGDHIRVRLEIMQKFNPDFKVYENKNFKILEFMEHIQSPGQGDMFD